ncbi:MAG: magnesium transporter [Rhodobacteraceae bacterium]|nr:MAG: magnesium transporter [Paracoccaceae bacterium]
MTVALTREALEAHLERGLMQALEETLAEEHPADVAALLADLPPTEAWRVLALMPAPRQAETFGYLPHPAAARLVETGERARLALVVSEMNADERADLYNALSETHHEAFIPALAKAEREDLRRLAAYPPDTAGALMTSDYATLAPDLSARAALEKLRLEAPDKETIYRAYVVDREGLLVGSVRLQDLILAKPDATVDGFMERRTLAVPVDADREDVARKIAKYDVLALPVVDADGRLVGIVTHDDATDAMEAEVTEDFHKAGGSVSIAGGLRDASLWLLYRARVPWLVVLVFGNLFSGAGIAAFEDVIAANVALVFFLPLLIDSGGNAGAQASTLMVRALATGDVRMGDWGRMLARELSVAFLLGLTMALAVSGLGYVRGGPEIAIIVASSMVIIVTVGSLIGMTLPFVLTRLKFDPATASAPLITSIADATGVLIYFAIATQFLIPAL